MNTNIVKLYLDLIKKLANNFSSKRANNFPEKSRVRVYNSTYSVYYNISIFLYIRLNKITKNKINFNFNRIHSDIFKKFSCKLYKSILDDLERNEVIIRNNHYLKDKKYGFSKSCLIHKNMIHKINESIVKFKYEVENIHIPNKILTVTGWTDTSNADDNFSRIHCLNTCYRTKQQTDNLSTENHYAELTYKEKDLERYCKDDEFLYNYLKKRLNRLKLQPKFVKGRFYHAFHEFSKDFREKVLRLDGEHIKEIFDVSGSDLHMLAKHLEGENIPAKELLRFQDAVKNDLRKRFGTRKIDGKCAARVKTAFKVYLNAPSEMYDNFRSTSYCKKIDDMFKREFPTIREFIVNHKDIWQISMNNEFDIISVGMINRLNKMGVKALTCHDSLYVNTNVKIPNIKDIFYEELGLAIDRMKALEEL